MITAQIAHCILNVNNLKSYWNFRMDIFITMYSNNFSSEHISWARTCFLVKCHCIIIYGDVHCLATWCFVKYGYLDLRSRIIGFETCLKVKKLEPEERRNQGLWLVRTFNRCSGAYGGVHGGYRNMFLRKWVLTMKFLILPLMAKGVVTGKPKEV